MRKFVSFFTSNDNGSFRLQSSLDRSKINDLFNQWGDSIVLKRQEMSFKIICFLEPKAFDVFQLNIIVGKRYLVFGTGRY